MVTLVLGIYSPQSNTLYPITKETTYQCDLKQSFHGNVVYDITSAYAGTTTSHISDTLNSCTRIKGGCIEQVDSSTHMCMCTAHCMLSMCICSVMQHAYSSIGSTRNTQLK